MQRRAIARALLGATILLAPGALARQRLVLLIENRSTNPRAGADVLPSVVTVLGLKGYEVVADQEVADFVDASAVPLNKELPDAFVDRMLLRFHADAVLVLTIGFFFESQLRSAGPRANPALGLSARLLSRGAHGVWQNSMGAIGDDAILARNRAEAISRMAFRACEQLFWAFPKATRLKEVTALQPAEPGPPLDEAPGGPRFPLVRARHSRLSNQPREGERARAPLRAP